MGNQPLSEMKDAEKKKVGWRANVQKKGKQEEGGGEKATTSFFPTGNVRQPIQDL